MTNVKRIESYGLFDFCKDIEAALTEGYVFDFDTNENFPTAYGSMFTCGLVKAGEEVETETEEVEVVVEVAPELSEIVAQIEQVGEVVNNEQQDETETQETTQETTEEATQAKRGPKPKNK
jgi:hypothetical protein